MDIVTFALIALGTIVIGGMGFLILVVWTFRGVDWGGEEGDHYGY